MTIKEKYLNEHPECEDFTKIFMEFCPSRFYKDYENESNSCPTDGCGNYMKCEDCWNKEFKQKTKFIVLKSDEYENKKVATIYDDIDVAKRDLEMQWQDTYNSYLAKQNVYVNEREFDTWHSDDYAVITIEDQYKVTFELIVAHDYI